MKTKLLKVLIGIVMFITGTLVIALLAGATVPDIWSAVQAIAKALVWGAALSVALTGLLVAATAFDG